MIRTAILAGASVLALTGGALADGPSVHGGIGLISINAHEYVFDGDLTLSHLIWQSRAPVLMVGFDFDRGRVTFDADLDYAFRGDSRMEDYDWLEPYVFSYDADDWTDRSIHEDTDLAHYLRGSIVLGYNLVEDDGLTVNVGAGFRYTDVKWDAYGGTFVYSVSGFRDTVGSFTPGEPGISYRQQFPETFIGLDIGMVHGAWTMGLEAEAGITIRAHATDDHWMRDLRFVDYLYHAPTLRLGASVGYAMSERASILAGIDYSKIFTARADTIETDTVTLETATYLDGAGASLRTISASVGFAMAF